MKIEAVIFDWAGTTVDYGCFAPVQTFMGIFHSYGIQVSMEETRKPMGMLKWDHIKTMLEMPSIHKQWKELYGREWTLQDIDEMHDKFTTQLLSVLATYTDVKPYVMDCIADLRKHNIRIGSTTGYTDEMMNIVVKEASKQGYRPDYWITPNSVNNCGRPYPYMIFHNMEALKIQDVHNVVKVGDTISDIQEAKAAGVYAIGIIEGSSLMGLSLEEYESLSQSEKEQQHHRVKKAYLEAGADDVIANLSELVPLLQQTFD